MKRYDKNLKYRIAFYAVILIAVVVGWFLREPAPKTLASALSGFVSEERIAILTFNSRKTGMYFYCIAALIIIVKAVIWSVRYNLFTRGLRHAYVKAHMVRKIKAALLETPGYTVDRNNQEADLPRIIIEFSKDMASGLIKIQNHIKYNKVLEMVDLSSALGRYLVEQQYLSDDSNYWIFEFEDAQTNRRLIFNDYRSFIERCSQCEPYTLFVDERLTLPVTSMLLVGATGSGKTYGLYCLILQLLNWKIKPKLYFSDPKNSSLCVLGKKISPGRTAGTISEIIEQLQAFHDEMQERKIVLQEKLEERLDADFRNWQMPANIFIFDEFSSFISVVNTMDKRTKDMVNMLLRNIILQGRQLGYFIWVLMQKSDSSDIPTAIRDNLIFKVVLGSATNTTYMTAFEHSADLPKRNFGPGEGLYTYQGITKKPKVTSFPTLNFDILSALDD